MSTTTLTEQAPGKVNLCLYLGGTREDGRHELVTVYESVALYDTLTLWVDPEIVADVVVCPGVDGPNLVSDALAALRAAGWAAPAVRIEIEKRIPIAAGMAGGSADAAAALRLARRLGGERIDTEVVDRVARELGSDVPGQLTPGLSLGIGAGEIVEQLAPLAEHAFVIVPLAAALSTPAVYREADRLELPRSVDDLAWALTEVTGWMRRGAQPPARLLVNDLAAAARSVCPEIDPALTAIAGTGAEQTIVCGSGPTCAGLWWGAGAIAAARDAAEALQARYPRAVAVRPALGTTG